MRLTFSLRHLLVVLLVVGLASILAGAVLAQTDVPAFDLAAVPAGTGIADPSPDEVTASTEPTFNWSVPVPLEDTTGFDFEIYDAAFPLDPAAPQGAPLTSTLVSGLPLPITPTCNETTGACAFSNLGIELQDGKAYYWRVISNGTETSDVEATFVVDLVEARPAVGQQVNTTTPIIKFPQQPNFTRYTVASYVPPRFAGDPGTVAWIEEFEAEGENGICRAGQCVVRPDTQITNGTEGEGDTTVQIWIQPGGEGGVWQPVFGNLTDAFTVLAPDVTVDVAGGQTPGRPGFSVARETTVSEQPNGLTTTITPDYYRVFVANANNFMMVSDEWYGVSACDANDVCQLTPYDGVTELLYNSPYRFWSVGYDTETNSYTAWTSGENFTINEPRPATSDIVLAGLYESVGPSPVNPNPKAAFSTWVPCEGTTTSAENICNTSRPILHFQPSASGYSGEWFEVAIYDPASNTLPFVRWLNIYDPVNSDIYWSCQTNTGAQGNGYVFEPLTCFFQLGELNGLTKGVNYEYYIRSWGPGGPSTGGIVGYTEPGGEGDPNNIARFRVRGNAAVTDLSVNLNALTGTLTGTYITGEPRFVWDHVPSATWYNIEVRTPVNPIQPNETFYNQWHQVGFGSNQVRCVNGVCAFTPPVGSNFFLFNGQYELAVTYWDGGISEPAVEAFTLSVGAPVAVNDTDSMVVYNNETIEGTVTPIFQWQHVQNNTWYQLKANGPTFSGQPLAEWYRAYDICSPDPNGVVICSVRPDIGDFLGEDGTFTWSVDSWSPANQVATGANATFTLESTPTGVPTFVYPSSPLTHTLTNTNTLELYFAPAANASWYQIFVGKQNPDGSYAAPLVNDWYYLPNPDTGYEYPSGAYNVCADGLTFGGSPRDGLCRIIPTELENGRAWPIEIWEDGNYQWWMRAYGPTGFSSQGVVEGWVRSPNDIRVDLGNSTPVDQTTIRNQDGILVSGNVFTSVTGFQWNRSPIAQWYRVEVYNEANDELQHLQWINREDAGCSPRGGSSICRMDITTNVIENSALGLYSVNVGTFSFGLETFELPDNIEISLPPEGAVQEVFFTKI
ncbi:MAG: hypothetical protein OHK0046_14610 [Anaerolineae bacterium]